MSRVTITELRPGDVANAADANATITSWNVETGPADVEGRNIRPEGVEHRHFSRVLQQFGDTTRRYRVDGAHPSSPLAIGTALGELATPAHIGGFDWNSALGGRNDKLVVRASFRFTVTPKANISATDAISAAIGYKPGSAGVPVIMSKTRRMFAAWGAGENMAGSCTIATIHNNPLAEPDQWFTLMIGFSGGGTASLNIFDVAVSGILYKR